MLKCAATGAAASPMSRKVMLTCAMTGAAASP
jgi:hypothetical protein